MIDIILNIRFAINSGYDKSVKDEIEKVNLEIYEHFFYNKIKFPIIPSVGMLVDLTAFYDKLSDNAKDWIDDANGCHEIHQIVICNEYLELRFN